MTDLTLTAGQVAAVRSIVAKTAAFGYDMALKGADRDWVRQAAAETVDRHLAGQEGA